MALLWFVTMSHYLFIVDIKEFILPANRFLFLFFYHLLSYDYGEVSGLFTSDAEFMWMPKNSVVNKNT